MLKTIIIIVVALLAAVLIYAATKPDTFSVQRSTSIGAPPEKIFALIDDLHSMNTWSPYMKKDPAMKISYSGPDSGTGAAIEWEGNREVGKGNLEITESSPPSRIEMKLTIIKPFEAHNIVEFTLTPEGEHTNVTWAMNGKQPYIAKVIHIFFNLDNMVGKDFQEGLANLKTVAEK
jgi:uncharacterized protein YndB with AHSA1/START domain